MLVYREAQKGKRVWLDFRRNPSAMQADCSNIGAEGYAYLKNSEALQSTPIARLRKMNTAAIELYRSHGIDLETEMLEIAVSAQHNNGGLSVDARWESNLEGFFPIGECSGTHGVYRPGGSALNAGQCGGLRAAQYIAARRADFCADAEQMMQRCGTQIEERIGQCEGLKENKNGVSPSALQEEIGTRMSRYVAHIRSKSGAERVFDEAANGAMVFWRTVKVSNAAELREAMVCYDMLLTQQAVAYAVWDYINRVNLSRGSYLIAEDGTDLTAYLKDGANTQNTAADEIQELRFRAGLPVCNWRKVRPIPSGDDWFENVWNDYLAGKHLDKE